MYLSFRGNAADTLCKKASVLVPSNHVCVSAFCLHTNHLTEFRYSSNVSSIDLVPFYFHLICYIKSHLHFFKCSDEVWLCLSYFICRWQTKDSVYIVTDLFVLSQSNVYDKCAQDSHAQISLYLSLSLLPSALENLIHIVKLS